MKAGLPISLSLVALVVSLGPAAAVAGDLSVERTAVWGEELNDYKITYDGYTYHVTDRLNPAGFGNGELRLHAVDYHGETILTYIPSGYLLGATCDGQTNWIAGGHGYTSDPFVVSVSPELAPGEQADADAFVIETAVVGYCGVDPAVALHYVHEFRDGVFTEKVRVTALIPFTVEKEYLAVLGVRGHCLTPHGFTRMNGLRQIGCLQEPRDEWLSEASYLHAEGQYHVAEARAGERLPVRVLASAAPTGPYGIKGFLVREGPREVRTGETWVSESSHSVHLRALSAPPADPTGGGATWEDGRQSIP